MWDIAPLLVSKAYFFKTLKKRWAVTLSLSRKLNLIGDQLTVICILPTGNVARSNISKLRFFLHMQPTVEGTVCHVVLT